MNTRQLWLGGIVALAIGACTQSYDDFDFSGSSTAVGGGGASSTTSASSGTSSTGSGGSGGSRPACDEQFDHPSILQHCDESASECTLRVRTNSGSSCNDICEAGGGVCEAFYDDEPSETCGLGPERRCDSTDHASAICVCSRG